MLRVTVMCTSYTSSYFRGSHQSHPSTMIYHSEQPGDKSLEIHYNRTMRPEEAYVERTCSLCQQKFHDSTPTYCRPCTNAYNTWYQKQRRHGLPTTIKVYREVMNKPRVARVLTPPVTRANVTDEELAAHEAKRRRAKVCPICDGLHRNPNHRSYCMPCHAAYQQWGRRRRNAGLDASVQAFRAAIESGRVVPRRDASHLGRVVRGI